MKRKNLKALNKLDRERELKKIAGEDSEKLEAMGQESEKAAAKWVMEEGEKERHEEAEQQAETEWTLNDHKDQVLTYKTLLVKELRRLMENWIDELPEGWSWYAGYNEKGIVLWLRDKDRNWYARGMKVSGLPKYDLNGIFKLMMKAIEYAKPKVEPQDTGIQIAH